MLCSRVQNLLSAYCDRELTGFEMLQIRAHLRECSACERERRALLQIKQALGALAPVEPRGAWHPDYMGAGASWAESWRRVARAALAPRRGAFAVPSFPLNSAPVRQAGRLGSAMALCGALVMAFLLGVVRAPQSSDAVSAQVPSSIVSESELNAASLGRYSPPPGVSLVESFDAGPSLAAPTYVHADPFFRLGLSPVRPQSVLLLSSGPSWRKVESH